MPATRAKYEDMQEITVTIPGNTESVEVEITHNLAKQHPDGVTYDYVDPDMVHVKFIDSPVVGSSRPLLWAVSYPNSPNGKVSVIFYIHGTEEGSVSFVARINCIYWHSIEGDDHTA